MQSPSSGAEPGGPPPRHYRGLDLIRGLAAIAVLVYHVDFMFGMRDGLLPGGYLSVDLFFILSGFVIACNYEASVGARRIGFARFMVRRLARLYPLYLLTFTAGLVVMTARYRGSYGTIDAGRLSAAALANLVVLPSFALPYGLTTLFPFNPASWSIFYELAINVAFATLLARMKGGPLVAAWVVAGLGLAAAAWSAGGVDVGWNTQTFAAAFPRVAFSFITGMLIWRARAIADWTTPGWVLAALVAACGLLFQAKPWFPHASQGLVDLVAVALLLPATVVAGVGARLEGRAGGIAELLGEVSYAVYLTQGSLVIAAAGLVQAASWRKIYEFAPVPGFLCVPIFIGVSYLTFQWFEAPARDLVRALVERRNRPKGDLAGRPDAEPLGQAASSRRSARL